MIGLKIVVLSKRDTSELVKRIESKLNISLGRQKNAKIIEVDKEHKIISISKYVFVEVNDAIAPFLKEEELLSRLPYIIVDKGATPHICNGAKIMRPGIVDFPKDFDKEQIVAVKEELHGKFIAIGKASCSSSEAKRLTKGIVLQNIHYVGDKLWEIYKEGKRKL
jgi:PUA domain protein